MSSNTDMAIQLFMQSTILLSNYYGYTEIKYADVVSRTRKAGLDSIPFMAPETVRATPELVNLFNKYEDDPTQLAIIVQKVGGYKNLVKYYIRTGLRASQSICRSYLLDLDEKSEYLDFIEKEVGVGYALSTAVLALVHANTTLTTSFLIARTGIDGALGAYQDYRYLSIDREAARALVEAAQNQYAQYFMQQVDLTASDPNLVTGGYTFSDALHAVSTIEYQCTRSGIKSLLARSINNSPTNLMIDPLMGTIAFRTAAITPVNQSAPGGVAAGNGSTGTTGVLIPPGGGNGTPAAVQPNPPAQKSATSQGSGSQTSSKSNQGDQVAKPPALCPTIAAIPDAVAPVTTQKGILAGTATLLANRSATFGLKTASDAAKAIIGALTCINTVLMQATGLAATQSQKDELQKVQTAIAARLTNVSGIVQSLKSATANQQTANDAATQLTQQLNGVPGLTGAVGLTTTALSLLRPNG